MREYVLSRAIASGNIGFSITSLFRNWQARRILSGIARWDDDSLIDLGVSRADIDWAIGLALTENPLLALEERTFRNQSPR